MARTAQATWSFFLPDWVEGTRRVVTDKIRQNSKLRGMAKRRARYAFHKAGKCALCLEALCYNVEVGHPARGEFGHTVALVLGGSSSPLNYHGTHAHCNWKAYAAGVEDLRAWVPAGGAWPSGPATERWEGTPHARRVRTNLPTVEAMDAARKTRGLPF